MSGLRHFRTPDRRCLCERTEPEPDRPTELSGSVGEGGVNRAGDVETVQSLLDELAPADGGPVPALAVDGRCGPLTKAAILRFQRRYAPELIADGRIDVDKNTWKNLTALTVEGGGGKIAKTPGKPGGANKPPANPADADNLMLLNAALYLSRWRIYEAIKSLDASSQELTACVAKTWFNVGAKPTTWVDVYNQDKASLKELPTFDRCFHIADPKMKAERAQESIRRVKKVYTDMLDVIIRNSFTTPDAEKTGARRFIHLVNDDFMKRKYPPHGAIAAADEGGWWKKNANLANIWYNRASIGAGDAITSLIHEMSHFVSHTSSYAIGDHHLGGAYAGAFNDTHDQAVRNSFCYEWYALLASFKHQRSTPNEGLILT